MSGAHNDDYQALSLAAHELRSPASVVVGYLRILLKGDAGVRCRRPSERCSMTPTDPAGAFFICCAS